MRLKCWLQTKDDQHPCLTFLLKVEFIDSWSFSGQIGAVKYIYNLYLPSQCYKC